MKRTLLLIPLLFAVGYAGTSPGADPAKKAEVPGKKAEVPGKKAEVPGKKAEVPGKKAEVPGKQETVTVPSVWASWRGPEMTGVSRETGLPDKAVARPGGENFVFGVPYSGLSSPIILNGKVYLLGRTGKKETQQEVVQAFDAVTGKLLWQDKFNVWLTGIVDTRLGFTKVAGDTETGNVYVHNTAGELIAYTGDGKILWKRSLTEEFGRVSGYGGRITTPIVDEDKVIIGFLNQAWGAQTIGATRLAAFDKRTGSLLWWADGGHAVKNTYYSMPVAAVIGGKRLILSGGGDGCLHAFLARTGQRVWSHKLADNNEAINATPVVQGNKIWIGHGEENAGSTQGRVVCLDGATVTDMKPKELWRVDGIKVKFATPVLHDGLLYIATPGGRLHCLQAEDGKELWTYDYGAAGKGSPTWADGKLYICEVDKKFHILKPSKTGCEELSAISFRGTGGVPVELHGTPAVCNGRIYISTTTQLVCFGKKDAAAVKVTLPVPPKEPTTKGQLAHIRVMPADSSHSPADPVRFAAYGYDANGRALGQIEVQWELAGMLPPRFPIGLPAPKAVPGAAKPPVLKGSLSEAKGKTTIFTPAKMVPSQFGRVVAKVGKITGESRVRVAPVLPYATDFQKVPLGKTPGGWVGAMGKFSVGKAPDGSLALMKRNNTSNALLVRATTYIAMPLPMDYTIEADVVTNEVRGKMADLGVGACRYKLVLLGEDQKLRLNTWDALYGGRVSKEMPFAFKAGTWYRLKLKVSIVDGKGVIQGKAWPRGEKEPAKWTIELADPLPNKEGSPNLYGYANGTTSEQAGPESFFDNVKITKN